MSTIISVQTANNTPEKMKAYQAALDYQLRVFGPETYANGVQGAKLKLMQEFGLSEEDLAQLDFHIVPSTPEVAQAIVSEVQQNGVTTIRPLIDIQLGLTGISQDLTRSPLIGTSLAPATETSGSIINPYNNAAMYKFNLDDAGLSEAPEISPYLKRDFDYKPMYIQMVDSSLKNNMGIGLSEGVIVTSLKLTPNPNSINISSAKMINRYHTMTRWVEEHWGDEIDVISANGSTYAFMAFAADGLAEAGLTVAQRDKTKAYLMLRELVKIFQTNGCIYQDASTYEGAQVTQGINTSVTELTATDRFLADPTNAYFFNKHPREGLIKERLYLNLYFDYLSVTGYFESFDILQEAGSPFRFTYSFVFKAERTKYLQGAAATANAVGPFVPVYVPILPKTKEQIDSEWSTAWDLF